jgi:hypothetical protein
MDATTQELNQLLKDIASDIFSLKNPKTGETIRFLLRPNEHNYLYYTGPRGEMYCYSPHPDTKGNYWVWTYKPIGKGSRSGKPHRWNLSNLVRCAKRKTAKAKAILRLQSSAKGMSDAA